MTYADLAIVGTVVLWGLAGLGVYHLAYRGSPTLRKTTPGRTEPRTVKPHRYRDVSDPTDQLDHVMAGKFSKRRLMGYSEYKVFKAVEEEVSLRHRGYRVFAQTSLGQILRSPDPAAHSSINSKRVDVLVIAPNGYPVVVIEYQGTGHFQGKAAARDAVKREALRKAGVEYLEICEFHTPDEARELVRSTLARATTSTSVPRFGRRAEQTSSYLPLLLLLQRHVEAVERDRDEAVAGEIDQLGAARAVRSPSTSRRPTQQDEFADDRKAPARASISFLPSG